MSKTSYTLRESSTSYFAGLEESSLVPFINMNFLTLCKKTTNVTQFTYILWEREVLDSDEFKTTLTISSDFLTNCYVYDLLMTRQCEEDVLEALQMTGNSYVYNLLKTHWDHHLKDNNNNNNSNNNRLAPFQDCMEVEYDDNNNKKETDNENTNGNGNGNDEYPNPMPQKSRICPIQEAFKSINLETQTYWFEVEDPVDSFVGREEFLQTLHQDFNETNINSKVTISSRIQVICGLEGMGKTEIVRKYIQDYGEHYDNVVWINGGSRENAQQSMEKIAETLQIPLNFSQESHDTRKFLVQKIYRYLCQRKKTLFIFDNFDFDIEFNNDLTIDLDLKNNNMTETTTNNNNDLKEAGAGAGVGALMTNLKQFLPSSLPSNLIPPSIIVTSRIIPNDLLNCHILDGLTSEESKSLILNQLQLTSNQGSKIRISEYQRKRNEVDAAALARELGGFPLALQHAISFMKFQNSFQYLVGRDPYTIQNFLLEFSKNPQRIFNYNNFSSKWDDLFSRIYPENFQKVSPGQILNFLIFLIPDDSCGGSSSVNTNGNANGAGSGLGIPSDLFFQFVHQHFTDCTSGEIANALALLRSHLAINFQNKVISMPPFIQTLVRERLVLHNEIITVLDQLVKTWIKFLPQQQIQDFTTVKYIPGNWKKRLISLSKFLDKYGDIYPGTKWPEFLDSILGKGNDKSTATEAGTGTGTSTGTKYEEILCNFFGKI